MSFSARYINHDSDTLNLSDGDIYRIIAVNGIMTAPSEPIILDIPRRTPRGIYVANNPLAREITLSILVKGSTPKQLMTRIEALRSHMRIDARDNELGVFDCTGWSGNRKYIQVTPWPDDGDDTDEFLIEDTRAPFAIIAVHFTALDFWYNPSAVTPSGNFSGTADVNISCANAGDEDAWATITIAGQATTPKITDHYGTWLEFVDDVDTGETLTLTLNPQELAMVHLADGNWLGQRKSGSMIPVIAHGTHDLTFTGGGAGDNGNIGVSFHSTYSRHG